MEYLKTLGYNENYCGDTEKAASDTDITARANDILNDAGLLDHILIDKANKPHWLYANLMINDYEIDNIKSSSLYKMLKAYPAGKMLKDISGYAEHGLL